MVGWLGLVIFFMTYLMESGRIPKPDLGFLIEGLSVKKASTELPFNEHENSLDDLVATERDDF